jgi:hypothetical protein
MLSRSFRRERAVSKRLRSAIAGWTSQREDGPGQPRRWQGVLLSNNPTIQKRRSVEMAVRPFLVNGEWWTGEGGHDRLLDVVGRADPSATFTESQHLPIHARADALDHISKRLSETIPEDAELIAREGGKPLRWATVEATRAVSTFRWASETIRHADRRVRPPGHRGGAGLAGWPGRALRRRPGHPAGRRLHERPEPDVPGAPHARAELVSYFVGLLYNPAISLVLHAEGTATSARREALG